MKETQIRLKEKNLQRRRFFEFGSEMERCVNIKLKLTVERPESLVEMEDDKTSQHLKQTRYHI